MLKWIFVGLFLLVSSPAYAQAQDRLNVNSATVEELSQLGNVGPARAAAIVSYREQFGPFRSIQDLTQVTGIGERTIEMNLDRITID